MVNEIDAIVQEAGGGAYYNIILKAIPHVGDLLSLYSYLDTANGDQAEHYYKVTSVVHEVRDVTNKAERSKSGYHAVKVVVTPHSSSAFK